MIIFLHVFFKKIFFDDMCKFEQTRKNDYLMINFFLLTFLEIDSYFIYVLDKISQEDY